MGVSVWVLIWGDRDGKSVQANMCMLACCKLSQSTCEVDGRGLVTRTRISGLPIRVAT